MPIVLISESLLLKTTARDGRILRDRVLCGFIDKLNARRRTFRVATSVVGKQFRMPLLNGFVSQGLSRRAMVVQLNDLGIKAPRGGTWALGQVQRIVVTLKPAHS